MRRVTLTFEGECVNKIAEKFSDNNIDGEGIVFIINSLFKMGMPDVEKIEIDSENLTLYFNYSSNIGE